MPDPEQEHLADLVPLVPHTEPPDVPDFVPEKLIEAFLLSPEGEPFDADRILKEASEICKFDPTITYYIQARTTEDFIRMSDRFRGSDHIVVIPAHHS